ncbi:hypothetical protein HMI54_014683 [Coelomomyces lativittatus]|nr:hypothetical protein HMI54_014683 [Coelomomyces lativittatus]
MGRRQGKNVGAIQGTQMWIGEVLGGKIDGHRTQVLNAKTLMVGCGLYQTENCYQFMCNYYPPRYSDFRATKNLCEARYPNITTAPILKITKDTCGINMDTHVTCDRNGKKGNLFGNEGYEISSGTPPTKTPTGGLNKPVPPSTTYGSSGGNHPGGNNYKPKPSTTPYPYVESPGTSSYNNGNQGGLPANPIPSGFTPIKTNYGFPSCSNNPFGGSPGSTQSIPIQTTSQNGAAPTSTQKYPVAGTNESGKPENSAEVMNPTVTMGNKNNENSHYASEDEPSSSGHNLEFFNFKNWSICFLAILFMKI